MVFEVNTAIVLGAGASRGYGYPTGDDLIGKILEKEKPTYDARRGRPSTPKEAAILRLCKVLRYYDPISIDAFLWHFSHNTDLVSVAKELIAEIIATSGIKCRFQRGATDKDLSDPENEMERATDSPSGDSSNWYRFLWNAIVSGQSMEELSAENADYNFNIITFNYDTSLEWYLYRCVTQDALSMFKTPEQQQRVLTHLRKRIHHVYGEVIRYPWMYEDEKGPIENDQLIFPKGREESLATQLSKNIHLIDERIDSTYDHIQGILQKAQQIIFLGFGFDDTNIGPKVLNLKALNRPFVKYTNLNDSEIINRKIVDLWGHSPKTQMKSTKKVYRAVSEDFSLNRF